MKQSVLALDLGTKTGWALRRRDGRASSGVVDLKTRAKEAPGRRYYRFKRFLVAIKNHAGGIDQAVYESVNFMPQKTGFRAVQNWGGLEAILTYWCEHHQIPYHCVHVATLKKEIAGNGHASKDDMMMAVRDMGFDPTDDNEGDALALMAYFERVIEPEQLGEVA